MNYQYSMQNMVGMLPSISPPFISNMNSVPPVEVSQPFIGPVVPENTHQNEDMNIEDDNDDNEVQFVSTTYNGKSRSSDWGRKRESRLPRFENRYAKDNNRNSSDRCNRGKDRSRERDWTDKHNKGNKYKNGQNSQWKGQKRNNDNDNPLQGHQGTGQMGMPNMIIPGAMMPYNNMNNMMNRQQMDMPSNMLNMPPPNLLNMPPNMPNMSPIPTPSMPNMVPSVNMIPMRMIRESMMMMNPIMSMLPNQGLYITDAVLLPPIPGEPVQSRSERPPGCRTIFVGGLPQRATFNVIEEIFRHFGRICDFKLHRQGSCNVRFEEEESVERSFFISGYKIKFHDQSDNETRTLFVDYALNRDDQDEFERDKNRRDLTPPSIVPCSPGTLSAVTEKIKNDELFADAAPTLAAWLERGECNKKNANAFYSLIQTSNNHVRRLCTEKMALDEEFHKTKSSIREKIASVVVQFEQVAKILTAAKHQRVSDHFTKQQRRNIEMWLNMTEEMDNIKEEFNALFDDDDSEKTSKNTVSLEKYEELKEKNKNLMFELQGYKNEAYVANDDAERKFEKFKAHFIAQQALQNQVSLPPYPTLPLPQTLNNTMIVTPLPDSSKTQPSTADDKVTSEVAPSDAKLISILTAFLIVHPLGASLDYLVSYVRSMTPNVTQATINQVLQKYPEIFRKKTFGIGASMDHRWEFVTFDNIKNNS